MFTPSHKLISLTKKKSCVYEYRSDIQVLKTAPPCETERTNGDSTVGAHQVNVGLGDGSHADLVVGSGEEGCERAGEGDGAVAAGTADGHAHLHTGERAVELEVRGFKRRKKLLPFSNWQSSHFRTHLSI